MTPRWLPVLAAATPPEWQQCLEITDMAVEPIAWDRIRPSDLVGISIHTLNANRGYRLMKEIQRRCGATVVLGGVHATIATEEALKQGADAVVSGDAESVFAELIEEFAAGRLKEVYDGGRVSGGLFTSAPRWDLLNHSRYMMATVQTTRGCPESCTFCSVWRTDGRNVRFRSTQDTIDEINQLYHLGFRIVVLADDNFYSVGKQNADEPDKLIADRMELMGRLERETPRDVIYLTQTTIRTADDIPFMRAMQRSRIRGVLIGIEAIDAATLKAINKTFNKSGEDLVDAVQHLQEHGIYVLGSHIVGLGPDNEETYPRMLELAQRSGMALAQFVQYTCFPGTVDYELVKRGKHAISFKPGRESYWLQPMNEQAEVSHPVLTDRQLRKSMNMLWRRFYATVPTIKRGWRLGLRSFRLLFAYWAFCKFYKRVYSKHGMAADSARTVSVRGMTRWLGKRAVATLKKPVVHDGRAWDCNPAVIASTQAVTADNSAGEVDSGQR